MEVVLRKRILPVRLWHLELLQEADAHIFLCKLGAADDAHVWIHHYIVRDGKRVKVKTEVRDLRCIFVACHFLFLQD